jgi:hypothetical protein
MIKDVNRLIVHAAANAQGAVDSILGSKFAEKTEEGAPNLITFETPISSSTSLDGSSIAPARL